MLGTAAHGSRGLRAGRELGARAGEYGSEPLPQRIVLLPLRDRRAETTPENAQNVAGPEVTYEVRLL